MAQPLSHKALYINTTNYEPAVRTIDTKYVPDHDQALIRVKFSAINPADIRHIYMGLDEPVSGLEWTGTVEEAGEASKFQVGDRAFGITMTGGSHQDYLLTDPKFTWRCPDQLDEKQAVALPVGMQTAADALLNALNFGFPEAGVTGRAAEGVPILIWGGASACGLSAIQIAKRAGFSPILTTASKKNHDILRQLGATACFDYRTDSVVEDIRQVVKNSGKQLTTVFDAVGAGLGVFEAAPEKPLDMAKSSPSLARQCCSGVDEAQLSLVAVLPVAHDSAWKFCLGTRVPGDSTMGFPQNPSWPGRVSSFMDWFVQNPAGIKMPNVKVVEGVEAGMEWISRVFNGGVSMEKVLIAHPFE